MKQQLDREIIKKNLFGEKNKIIMVQSSTNPNKYYELDKRNKTCNCKSFIKSGDKKVCKHLKFYLGIKDDIGFPASLLKSAMQKAIRRGDCNRALKSAKAFLRKNPNDFFRRLAIIIVEDAILHPDFRRVVELSSISARKSFKLTKEIENFALTIVEQLAKCEIRDYEFISYNNNFKSINIIPYIDWKDLKKSERDLVMALKWREKMGGMKGDMRMLSFLTRIWSHRFKEKIITLKKLRDIYKVIKTKKDYSDINLKLEVNDFLPEAADFHIFPIVKILMRKNYIINLVKKLYPNDVMTIEERIKDIIWKMRSGVNYKKDILTGEQIDWFIEPFNRTPKADRAKYQQIFQAIEEETNNISLWFIKKNK